MYNYDEEVSIASAIFFIGAMVALPVIVGVLGYQIVTSPMPKNDERITVTVLDRIAGYNGEYCLFDINGEREKTWEYCNAIPGETITVFERNDGRWGIDK